MKKATNPKDKIGSRKWRVRSCVPIRVLWELGIALLEGGYKYGRHNYRVMGVRASVYYDAAAGHIDQWWEGEDIDPDSGLNHVIKAIASLTVLRDSMMEGNWVDDRPPKVKNLPSLRQRLQVAVDNLREKHPSPAAPFLQTPATWDDDDEK